MQHEQDDLLALAPKWLEVCHKIRKDTLPWDKVQDWRKESPIQLSWTAEQWAYLLSAASMGACICVSSMIIDFVSLYLEKLYDDIGVFVQACIMLCARTCQLSRVMLFKSWSRP